MPPVIGLPVGHADGCPITGLAARRDCARVAHLQSRQTAVGFQFQTGAIVEAAAGPQVGIVP
jgi:hypothetical protein